MSKNATIPKKNRGGRGLSYRRVEYVLHKCLDSTPWMPAQGKTTENNFKGLELKQESSTAKPFCFSLLCLGFWMQNLHFLLSLWFSSLLLLKSMSVWLVYAVIIFEIHFYLLSDSLVIPNFWLVLPIHKSGVIKSSSPFLSWFIIIT